MKKLLSIMSLIALNANMLAVMPQQSIFTDTYAYHCVPVDTNKLVVANSIISPDHQGDLYRQLTNCCLTKENILNVVNCQYNTSGKLITDVHGLHLCEILKKQKNIIMKENHKLVMDKGPVLGDNVAQDYQAFLIASVLLNVGATYGQCAPIASVTYLVSLGCLYKLYKINNYIRSREAQMNKIDEMISKIEQIERDEATAKAVAE